MGGEPVPTARVDGRGMAGDRTYAVYDEFKGAPRRLTAREAPRLLAWSASYGGADVGFDVPAPVVTGPGGEVFAADDPALAGALSDDLGRAVAVRRDLAGQQDLPDSLLVTTEASLLAASEGFGEPLDLRRFRTNVHLDGDAGAFAEDGWEGRRLDAGGVPLVLLHPCKRCVIPTRDPDTQAKHPALMRYLVAHRAEVFGINARPGAEGRVDVGAPVTLI